MSICKLNSGIKFDYLNPTADMILLDDITHNLSKEQRFGNCLDEDWSVLQHILLVYYLAKLEEPENYDQQYKALHHDDAEAYMRDIKTPLKKLLKDYQRIYKNIESIIEEKFSVDLSEKQGLYKGCDQSACYIEDILFSAQDSWWHDFTEEDITRLDAKYYYELSPKIHLLRRLNRFEVIEKYLEIHNDLNTKLYGS